MRRRSCEPGPGCPLQTCTQGGRAPSWSGQPGRWDTHVKTGLMAERDEQLQQARAGFREGTRHTAPSLGCSQSVGEDSVKGPLRKCHAVCGRATQTWRSGTPSQLDPRTSSSSPGGGAKDWAQQGNPVLSVLRQRDGALNAQREDAEHSEAREEQRGMTAGRAGGKQQAGHRSSTNRSLITARASAALRVHGAGSHGIR